MRHGKPNIAFSSSKKTNFTRNSEKHTLIILNIKKSRVGLNIKKIVVGTPYLDEINKMEKQFLINKGFEVLDIQGLNLETGVSFGKVTPSFWKKFALEINTPEADGIFLSCGGIRSLDVIEEIEDITKKPVITSNQAQMWSCLRRAGIKDDIKGFGMIFSREGNLI